MSLADIYQLTLTQSLGTGGERVQMGFYFAKGLGATDAAQLNTDFLADGAYLAHIHAVQSDFIKDVEIRTINLGDLADFDVRPLTGAGADGSDMLPPHNAVNFSLKLDTRAVRPGARRLVGLTEADQTQGRITLAAAITALNVIGNDWATALPFGGASSYIPVVVKRIKVVTTDDPPRTFYRLPTTDGELVAAHVTAVLVNLKISHQVSRGNGR